ncbi:MAG: 50S ribosomal protein L4 [Armatimonadetes bacterium]|nr:50S ribosomal protein L4 [Armatimonadota bacterium]
MPEVAVLNTEGAEVGKINLAPEIFEVEPNESVVHAAVIAHLAKIRRGTADTKVRSEVSGGGAKPWRQKGTGRARQGSIRAPHWRHGGVVFGPHPRDYDLDMPKKVRRLAMCSALSAKLAEGGIKIVEDIKLDEISTKKMVEILDALDGAGKTMLVLAEPDETIIKSARNIPSVAVRISPSISVYDILNADTLIFTKAALAKLQEAQIK